MVTAFLSHSAGHICNQKMADEPPSEVVTHYHCNTCECDIPLSELFDHNNSCVKYRASLACGRCGHGGYIGQKEVNKHHKLVHYGKVKGAPGCKNIFLRAAVPSSTERFGGKLVCGRGLKESTIKNYVNRLQMLHQAGSLYVFQQHIKQATSNRDKLYSLANKIRAWCILAHPGNNENAAAELEALGLGLTIGREIIYVFPTSKFLIIQPSLSSHPDPPREGEIHEHPEVKRHEWRFHNVLIKVVVKWY